MVCNDSLLEQLLDFQLVWNDSLNNMKRVSLVLSVINCPPPSYMLVVSLCGAHLCKRTLSTFTCLYTPDKLNRIYLETAKLEYGNDKCMLLLRVHLN